MYRPTISNPIYTVRKCVSSHNPIWYNNKTAIKIQIFAQLQLTQLVSRNLEVACASLSPIFLSHAFYMFSNHIAYSHMYTVCVHNNAEITSINVN